MHATNSFREVLRRKLPRRAIDIGRSALWALADLAWPPECAACEAPLGDSPTIAPVCAVCDDAWPWVPPGGCALCQCDERALDSHGRCAACRTEPAVLARCFAAVELTPDVSEWIHRFKYPLPGPAGLDRGPERLLQHWLSLSARFAGPTPDAVTCIPLHPRKLRARGFNPAALLARALARELRRPFLCDALIRTRDDPSQTGLGRHARRRNVEASFAAPRGQRLPRTLWLIDDVTTTGATLSAAARALERAGAREVIALCAARTPEPPA